MHRQQRWGGTVVQRSDRVEEAGVAGLEFGNVGIAEESESVAALLQQMRRCQSTPGKVVRADRGLNPVRNRRAPDDQRAVAARDILDGVRLIGLADDDDAIDAPRINNGIQPRAIGRDHARQQQVVAAIRQRVGERTDQAHEERIGQMLVRLVTQRQDDSDRLRPPEAQVAGKRVDAEPVLGRQGFDTVARRLGDDGVAGECARYGRYRHAGKLRQIGKAPGDGTGLVEQGRGAVNAPVHGAIVAS